MNHCCAESGVTVRRKSFDKLGGLTSDVMLWSYGKCSRAEGSSMLELRVTLFSRAFPADDSSTIHATNG